MFYNMAFGDMIPVSEDEMLAPTKTADFLQSESLRYPLRRQGAARIFTSGNAAALGLNSPGISA